MGNNIDFTKMLGLPKVVICPRCSEKVDSMLDDYDIDCYEVQANANGCVEFKMYCTECEWEWTYSIPIWATPKLKCKSCADLRDQLAKMTRQRDALVEVIKRHMHCWCKNRKDGELCVKCKALAGLEEE